MVRSLPADELLRRAREAAGTRDVRVAVRDLTLHALRSRPLSSGHIATVARTVGQGIRSCPVTPVEPVRQARREAWRGLEDAVGDALQAVEAAARDFAREPSRLSPAQRRDAIEGLAGVSRALDEEWDQPRFVPEALRARIATVATLLGESPAGARTPASAGEDDDALSRAASEVLQELSERTGENASGTPPRKA